jgi:signal peptidase II
MAAPETSPRRTARRWWGLLAGITPLVVVIDQLTKLYVDAHLPHGASWMPSETIASFFQFTHVHNTGAAFGLFPDGNMVFLVIALIVSLVILYYYRHITERALLLRLALALQLSGALGNAIDRVRVGYVIDFFDVEFWPLADWPVFNVADSCIVIGVLLLAVEMWREERRLATEKKAAEDADSSSEEEPQYG